MQSACTCIVISVDLYHGMHVHATLLCKPGLWTEIVLDCINLSPWKMSPDVNCSVYAQHDSQCLAILTIL